MTMGPKRLCQTPLFRRPIRRADLCGALQMRYRSPRDGRVRRGHGSPKRREMSQEWVLKACMVRSGEDGGTVPKQQYAIHKQRAEALSANLQTWRLECNRLW